MNEQERRNAETLAKTGWDAHLPAGPTADRMRQQVAQVRGDETPQDERDLESFVDQIAEGLAASGDGYELSGRDDNDAVLEVWFNETRFIVRIDVED
jgi:hypothetical protein